MQFNLEMSHVTSGESAPTEAAPTEPAPSSPGASKTASVKPWLVGPSALAVSLVSSLSSSRLEQRSFCSPTFILLRSARSWRPPSPRTPRIPPLQRLPLLPPTSPRRSSSREMATASRTCARLRVSARSWFPAAERGRTPPPFGQR